MTEVGTVCVCVYLINTDGVKGQYQLQKQALIKLFDEIHCHGSKQFMRWKLTD